MTTKRLPPRTTDPDLDFLFGLQDEQGLTTSALARAIHTAPALVHMMRAGQRKRVVNPTVVRIAAYFGYEFVLVPIENKTAPGDEPGGR